MEYQRFGSTLYVRVDRGEEIMDDLRRLALRENIRLAAVTGLGAVDQFTVGVYDVDKREYHALSYAGAYEITSLVGTINTMNGEYYAHLHMSAADEDGTAVGGHLNSARISGTGELVITVTDGTVDRFKDEKETGLNLFSFPEGTRL